MRYFLGKFRDLVDYCYLAFVCIHSLPLEKLEQLSLFLAYEGSVRGQAISRTTSTPLSAMW